MAGPLHMGSPRVASPRCGPSHKVACRCTDGGINRRQGTQLINRIVQETINVGTETAAALKAQTEQMSPVVNELDSIHFSIKKASQLVKEIGTQVATDRCIMAMLFLIFGDVIAIIIVKIYSLTLVLESFIILKKNPKYHEE